MFPFSGLAVSTGEGLSDFEDVFPGVSGPPLISFNTICGGPLLIAAPLVALLLLSGESLSSSSFIVLVEAFLEALLGRLAKNIDGFVSVGSLPSGDTKLGDSVVFGECCETIWRFHM